MAMTSPRGAAVLALASAALFGMSTPLAKLLTGAIPPLMLAGLLYAGSGAGLSVVLIGRRLVNPVAQISLPQRGEWRWLAVAVFFGGVLGPVSLMFGLTTSAASTASLLLNLEAVFTALLAWFLFKENFDRRIALGMFAIVAGGVILVWSPGHRDRGSLGLAFVALACLCWAIDNNLTRKVAAADAVVIAGIKGVVAGAVNLMLALLLGETVSVPRDVYLALAVGFLGYGVSLVLFVVGLRNLGTARASAYFAVAPFFGAALALVLQDDSVSPRLIASASLMAAGVCLHLTENHRHRHSHQEQNHAHMHVHDVHHQHSHDFAWDGKEPHSHPHVHAPLTHSHAHFPDIHHRHSH